MVVHFIFPYPLSASGSGLLLQDLSANLTASGVKTHLLTVEREPYRPRDTACTWDGLIIGDGFPLDHVPVYTRIAAPSISFAELDRTDYEAYCEALKRHWQEALSPRAEDIVVVSHLWTHASLLKELGVRVDGILVHGTDLLAYDRAPWYRDQVAASTRWARWLIVNSDATRQKVLARGLGRSSGMVKIPPGIDTRTFSLGPCVEVPRPPVVLHVPGKFVTFKGTDRLLRAVPVYESEVPGVRTLITGTGPLPAEVAQLRDAMSSQNVEWREAWMPRAKLASLLRSASVLVVPSRDEPFGMIAAEALACGTAVVCDNSGGLRDIVGPGDGELVDADDPRALADAIVHAIGEKPDRERARRRAERAAARFGWPAIIKRWREWLSNAGERPASG